MRHAREATKISKRSTIVLIGVAVPVVIAGIVTVGVLASARTEPNAPAAAPPSSAELPHVAVVQGQIADWGVASPSSMAAVLPEMGAAFDGATSVRIDAPGVVTPTAALTATVNVVPGTRYEVSMSARVLSEQPIAVPVIVKVAEAEHALGSLDAEWSTEGFDFTAPEGQNSTSLEIIATAPISGLGVDDVRVTTAGGPNLVSNPSFEVVALPNGIVNESLVMAAKTAMIAVSSLAPGMAQWSVVDSQGGVEEEGAAPSTGPVITIPLTDVRQGYYSFEIMDSAGASLSSPVAIVDGTARSDSRLGVVAHLERDWYSGAARTAASVGFGAVRNDVLWDWNEKSRGEYAFDPKYVDGFAAMHANGIETLGIIDYANKLYDSGKTPSSEAAVAAYGRYAAAATTTLGLSRVEVFNEYNQDRFVTSACGSAPDCYLPLLKAVSDSVHAAAPGVPVIAGATALYDSPWFTGLWQAGGIAYADGMSFHPYEVVPDVNSLPSVIDQAGSDMDSAAGERRPISITELGWTTAGVDQQTQASALVQAEVISLSAGLEGFYWYDLIDDSEDPADHEGNFGLFDRPTTTVAAPQPKLAAFAQALVSAQIGGLAHLRTEDLGVGVRSEVFGTTDAEVRVMWGKPGLKVKVPSDHPLMVTDLMGETTTVKTKKGTAAVTLGSAPVFVAAASGTAAVSAN